MCPHLSLLCLIPGAGAQCINCPGTRCAGLILQIGKAKLGVAEQCSWHWEQLRSLSAGPAACVHVVRRPGGHGAVLDAPDLRSSSKAA